MATEATTKRQVEEIEPFEAAREIEGGDVVLIDTREPHEYQEAHLENGKLVPPGLLRDEIASAAPDKSARTILYCRSGNRSYKAAEQLQALGYADVASMAGGILAWQEQGLPVLATEGMTPEQRDRYSRHTLLPEVGVDGQLKMLNAKVLLLGAGGLGAPTALYLAAAGIGTIGLVDDDVVDASNLQRQVIHNTERIGTPKTESARLTIEALNPDVKVIEHRLRLDAENILGIIEDYDVIVDGADNFPTRYLLNDASVRLRKPVVSASILSFDGQISTFVPFEGPCYRCLYPTPPPPELAPSCSANGVLGVMAGTMGTLQANEVLKLVMGIGEPLVGRLLLYEALGTRFTELKVRRDPECPICGENAPEIPESEMGQFPDYAAFCAG
ncbi:MAG: sulfur-carrier protein adenylyltransferase/sulfurtransferase [Solirubrobacterales bacterium]|jgi:molybdopterin/thiamine biosynthesis adenylyltransferase/rhodanese-related sulfurtransferase|nr:sulfur-carrier protein adenylyltransferase/sulfurtransferase [Solirubrobacterales bacterium]